MLGALANPNVISTAVQSLGYLGSLSTQDVRHLQETLRVPTWLVVGASFGAGVAACLWTQSKLRSIQAPR